MAIRRVPPFWSLGLNSLPLAASNAALVEPLPPPLLFPLPLLFPPQAARLSAATALTAMAVVMRFLLIVLLHPFYREPEAPWMESVRQRDRGSSASRSPSPKRLKASTVMKMASPAGIM